jgi:hypothetical protein
VCHMAVAYVHVFYEAWTQNPSGTIRLIGTESENTHHANAWPSKP